MLRQQKFKSPAGVYMIRNTLNQQSYIGQTVDLYKRKRDHKYIVMHGGKEDYVIYKAMRKYGLENFEFIVLEFVEDTNSLDEREVYYIKKYDTYKNGYNMTTGGDYIFDRTGIPATPKITEEDVRRIRKMYAGPSLSLDEAYEKSGVKDILTKRGFQAIWTGQSWKHIDYDLYLDNKERQANFSRRQTANHAKKISDEEVREIRKQKKRGVVLRGDLA